MKTADWRSVLLAAAVAMSACARAERSVLEQFFGGSRLRDTTALQRVSTVVFEPRQDGIVRTFEITAVSPERIQQSAVLKDVTVAAPVVQPDGQTVAKTIVITMQRGGAQEPPEWRVVAFRAAAASPLPAQR